MMALVVLGFVALLALVFLGLPVAFAMALVGFAGMATIVGYDAAATHVALIVTETVMNYTFSVAALFILMANLVARARLSEELYAAAFAFIGHRRGGPRPERRAPAAAHRPRTGRSCGKYRRN